MTDVRKILCLILLLLMAVSFSSCGFLNLLDDRAEKADIFTFVNENKDTLAECISKNDYTAIEGNNIIQKIKTDEDIVEFFCGGSGFGSATSYRGFYYSADDDMTAIWCGPLYNEPLTKSGDGYSWEEKNGDNTYYTENICGHFYYYDASF